MNRQRLHILKGFTLIELLISLFIFSLITVASVGALNGAIRSKDQLDQYIASVQKIEIMRRLFITDMSNIILRDNRDESGNFETLMFSGGLDSLLNFTRAGRINPGGVEARGDVQRVRYIFEDGKLIREIMPYENPGPYTTPYQWVLLEGLQHVEIEFLSANRRLRSIRVLRGDNIHLNAVQLRLEWKSGEVLTQIFEVNI